jgi:hypothetical protein
MSSKKKGKQVSKNVISEELERANAQLKIRQQQYSSKNEAEKVKNSLDGSDEQFEGDQKIRNNPYISNTEQKVQMPKSLPTKMPKKEIEFKRPPPASKKGGKNYYQEAEEENDDEIFDELDYTVNSLMNSPKNISIITWLTQNAYIDNNLTNSRAESLREVRIVLKFIQSYSLLNFILLKESEFPGVNFDFTGVESLTDFMIYRIVKILQTRSDREKINFDDIPITACKNLTIWSVHYLAQAKDKEKSLLSLSNANMSVQDRVAGCDLISHEMAASLKNRDNSLKQESKTLCENNK